MGILKDLILIANQEFNEDNNSHDDEILFSDSESVESIRIQLGNYRKLKKVTKDKPQDFLSDNFYRFGERSSKRRQRIIDNNKFLIQLGGDLEKSNLENALSIDDFMVNNYSAFSLLFSAVENFEAWEEFINLNEENQEKILNFFEKRKDQKLETILEIDDVNEDLLVNVKPNINLNQNSGCKVNNSLLNAKLQYLKIDNHIKELLTKKNIPVETLLDIECNLREYFTQFPNSTFRTILDNSYQRLFIHGICKYLDLNSRSENSCPKETVVKNRHKIFTPPSLYLVEYLGKNVKEERSNGFPNQIQTVEQLNMAV